ncbi:unnamed protein product, partial [Notodromas monacha]
RGLVLRVVPKLAKYFNVTVVPQEGGGEYFKVLKADGEDQAVVTGSSGVACAWGLNHYLKHFCGTHLSWNFGVENVFEGDLPPVDILINISPR